ncbi:MFS transporter [Aurantimonas endophytica]|uniref:MFS family permease n=1 Tax=Aurantimonas endophytica TaxID=1522175 RepID=A0A7W6HE71_9HYPH|nr:MFS transporter [Aurantimonas endophytica]MBB4003576.1 MFS family permease [Aurantimonas endophytica]MCO6404434.1 MFS transporter [Aurantimonas endophytica]
MHTYGRFLATNARWLAGGFLLTFFSAFGQTFFIALSNGEIRRTFDLSHGDFGGIYMLATLLSALTLPFLGRLLDRYSIATVATGTMLLLAAAIVMFGLVWSLPTLVFAIYMLRLFGQGMMSQTALTATGRWFAANRGRAISITTIGFRVGEGCFPFLFVLAAGYFGWRGAWFAAAVLVLLALPLIVALVRVERDPQSEPVSRAQAEMRNWTRGEVLRDWRFYVISLGVFAPPFIGTTIFFHQVYLTEIKAWPLHLFASGFAVMSVTTIVFTLAAGWLVDRFSAVRLLPAFLLPLALSCFAIAWLTPEWSIFVFMGLLGVSFGFSGTIEGAMWPELYGTRHLGAIRSMVVAAMVLATAIGPGLTGLLIDAGIDLPVQFAVMGGYSLVAALAMWLVARKMREPVTVSAPV